MQIRMVWIKRDGKCSLATCDKPILRGEKAIKGYLAREGTWAIRCTWHIECWIEYSNDYLEANPPVPIHRTNNPKGRPATLQLTPTQRRARYTILQKIYRLRTSKDMFINLGLWWRVVEVEEQIANLIKELDTYGGPPSHWQR